MKSYNKSSGWLVKMVGGPSDGGFLRSYKLQDGPDAEAAALQPRIRVWSGGEAPISPGCGLVTTGEYVLAETFDKKGQRKLASAAGGKVPMFHYEWEPTDG